MIDSMWKSLPYPHLNFLREMEAEDPRFQEIMQEIHEAASQLDGVRFNRLRTEACWYLEGKRSDLEDQELDDLRKGIQAYLGIEHDETGK